MAHIVCLPGKALIKIDEHREVHTPGGVVVPVAFQHGEPRPATIRHVAAGSAFAIGQRVLVRPQSGHATRLDYEDLMCVSETEFLALLRPENTP